MLSEDKMQVLKLYTEGRKLYKLLDFKKAKEYFASALALDPSDGPSKVYYERCEHFINDPPNEDWDGVYVMKHK